MSPVLSRTTACHRSPVHLSGQAALFLKAAYWAAHWRASSTIPRVSVFGSTRGGRLGFLG